MRKDKAQYLKKAYDSPDWNPISKTQLAKELVSEDLEILEKTGRKKTYLAIYQKA